MTTPLSNRLLQALPPDYRSSLIARMEPVDLPLHKVIAGPGETPKHACFVTSGIVSLVAFMEDGNGVEVGLIGSEGLAETFHLLGSAPIQTTSFVQVEGTGLNISFSELKKEFLASEPLRTLILQAAQAQGLMATQLAACNRLHEIEERLARWLLMVSDRVGDNRFSLTQEFLAEMIGAQRTSVTMAAGSLQRSGLIEYRRGNIRILDREGLESAACECYPIVRNLVSNLYI